MTKKEIILTVLLLAAIIYGYFKKGETKIIREHDHRLENLLIQENKKLSDQIDAVTKLNIELRDKYNASISREKENKIIHEKNNRFIDSASVMQRDSIIRSGIEWLRTK